jgi:hypothetical protein
MLGTLLENPRSHMQTRHVGHPRKKRLPQDPPSKTEGGAPTAEPLAEAGARRTLEPARRAH